MKASVQCLLPTVARHVNAQTSLVTLLPLPQVQDWIEQRKYTLKVWTKE